MNTSSEIFILTIFLVIVNISGQTLWINGLCYAVCILILFPVIVSMGVGSEDKGVRSTVVCKYYNGISYSFLSLGQFMLPTAFTTCLFAAR